MKRLFLVFMLLLAGSVQARLNIEITGGTEGALPIAIVPFGWTGAGAAPTEDVAAIVAADLRRSGRFAPLANEQLVARPHDGQEVNFARWRGVGSDNLLVGRVRRSDQRYVVQFQLFDVLRGQQLAGYSIRASAHSLRRVAHQISDIVYQKLTGERGAFDTHIAYVTVVRGEDGKRRYRLDVADADGYNEQVVLTSAQPLLSPAWSPDGTRLAYVSFEGGSSAVYLQYIATGQRQRVAAFDGLNGAPKWSPDGTRLALTLSKDGNAEVYVLDLRTQKLLRITHSYAIDTEPDWAPDGSSLVFTSDRGGRPQIYRVGIGPRGAVGQPQRLTFEGDYNAAPSLSPDGKSMVMVHSDRGAFRIAIQDLSTGALRVLTQTRLDESPSFAPNGSMVIYATDVGGRGVLEVVSVDGRAGQRLALRRGNVREPAWSPFMTK